MFYSSSSSSPIQVLLLFINFVIIASIIFIAFSTIVVQFTNASDDIGDNNNNNDSPLVTIALVADNHYDHFPAGEKAPWQPMNKWLEEQVRRTTTTTKRRYDIAKDKMLEAVDVFNKIEKLTFAVNLGDLVNNGIMWNLKPILDAFNSIRAPKFSILGNHDLRSHNDRFGKNNKTQEKWMMSKLGLKKEWFYDIDYAPFMFIFLDSMVMEEPESNPKRRLQLKWLRETLNIAKELKRVVILFGHISIGLQTSPFAPILKDYSSHIVGGFFGHHHKGGYLLQDGYFHTTIIQGQIETMTNAFAVLEVFKDRMELTGFGRVPTRVMKFEKAEARNMIQEYFHESSSAAATDAQGGGGGSSPLLGKASEKHGYEKLVEGGPHKPAASPAEVFPKHETLQKPPPLMLNLASYRKPLVNIAEPNPGETRFLKKVYSTWQKRQKTLAPEPVVDLSGYNTAMKKKTPVLYQIGGKEDPQNKGKILQHNTISSTVGDVRNNDNEYHQNGKSNVVEENDEATAINQKKKNNYKFIKNQNQRFARSKNVVEDEDDGSDGDQSGDTKSSTIAGGGAAATSDDNKMFFLVESILIVSCCLVVIFIGIKYRRLFFGGGRGN